MKQNILVTSYDYSLSKQIATILADVFSMRLFDQKELFEFDHIPMTFAEIYNKNGEGYILKELKSILKMEMDFENAVFVADISFADNSEDLFEDLKEKNFIILLKKAKKHENLELMNKIYNSKEEQLFFEVDSKVLKEREARLINSCSDVVLDIDYLTINEIIEKIVENIKKYYNVN